MNRYVLDSVNVKSLLDTLEKSIADVFYYNRFELSDKLTKDSITRMMNTMLDSYISDHNINEYKYMLQDAKYNQLSLDILVVPHVSTSIINMNFKYESICEYDILPDTLFNMET